MTHHVSRTRRIRQRVRLAITGFVVILLVIVALGWIWTARHQPPALRIASHIVLGIAAVAGVFAIARIWRTDGRDSMRGRPGAD